MGSAPKFNKKEKKMAEKNENKRAGPSGKAQSRGETRWLIRHL